MEKSEQMQTSADSEAKQDHRVQVTSKKEVTKLLNRYKEVLKRTLDGQTEIEPETKRLLVQELLAVICII